jgi:AcrR family transcriptional regulator
MSITDEVSAVTPAPKQPEALPRPGRAPAAIDRPGRRSRRTRGELVAAARALLAEEGVEALTVKAVTDRADVGHGTFYHHYPSTEALLTDAIEASMREMSEALEKGFASADDKAWVFVASMSATLRALAGHPALGWMLERPHVLATALREACGPFAMRDIDAMVAAGDVDRDVLDKAPHYWEWLIIGALVDVAAGRRSLERIEEDLLGFVLRVLGLGEARIHALLARLGRESAPAARKAKR